MTSIYYIWNYGNFNDAIRKIFDLLEKVLCLIHEGQGSTNLVESKRGLKHEGFKFDHLKNIQYQKEAIFVFIDDTITDGNVANNNDGGEVEFEESMV